MISPILTLTTIFGFYLSTFIFGCSLIPKFARLGFLISLVLLYCPILISDIAPLLSSSGLASSDQWLGYFNQNFSDFVNFFIKGFLTGTLVSFAAYAALLAGTWISRLITCRNQKVSESSNPLASNSPKDSILLAVLLLLNLAVLNSKMASALFSIFSTSFAIVPDAALSLHIGKFIQLTLQAALLIAIPLFIAAALSDLMCILLERYNKSIAGEGFFVALRMPFIFFILIANMEYIQKGLNALIRKSVSPEWIAKLLAIFFI